MTTTPINRRQASDRLGVEAACARMQPNPDRLAATIAAFTAQAHTAGYWPLVVDSAAKAINLIHVVHAGECRQAGCGTCAAISLAVTAVTAHLTVAGGLR